MSPCCKSAVCIVLQMKYLFPEEALAFYQSSPAHPEQRMIGLLEALEDQIVLENFSMM